MNSAKTAYVIRTVEDAYDVLTREMDLSPANPKVNDALTRLVQTLSKEYTPDEERHILMDRTIRARRGPLLQKLALAESEMERFWAEKLCKNDVITQEHLEDFWYWQNYNDLVGGEAVHIPQEIYRPNESICFVGSGPLPLTAIVLNQKTGRNVTCVDIDPVACEASERFIRKAGYANSINIVCTDGADYNYRLHPAVLIAALVPNKGDVMKRVKDSAENPSIGIRSAERLHTLLYDPIDEDSEDYAHCVFTAKTAHNPRVINTTVFFQATPATDFDKTRIIEGHARIKYGWRNDNRPILPPPHRALT